MQVLSLNYQIGTDRRPYIHLWDLPCVLTICLQSFEHPANSKLELLKMLANGFESVVL